MQFFIHVALSNTFACNASILIIFHATNEKTTSEERVTIITDGANKSRSFKASKMFALMIGR